MPTANSNTVTVTVGQVGGVTVSPASGSIQTSQATPAAFGITVTNTGNGTDTFDLSSSALKGSTVSIYKDANGDGVWQATETTTAVSTGSLAINGTFKCLVVTKLPSASTSDTVTFTAKSRFNTAKTGTSTLTVQSQPVVSSANILTWLVNGYYGNTNTSTRMTTDYLGGEAGVAPIEGGTTAGKTWYATTSATNYVDLWAYYGNPNYCSAYAFAYVYSPTTQTVNMWMGSDDGIKVWVNGTVAWNNDVLRAYVEGQDKTTVSLKAGWNKVLVKSTQGTSLWGFSLKLCDSAGSAIDGLVYATTPTEESDTTAPTISSISATASGTSVVIEWDTDELSSTMVDYGTDANLGESYSDETMVTHHKATITGLTAGTTYYYRPGSSDAAANVAWGTTGQLATKEQPVVSSANILTWLVNGYYGNTNTSTRMTTDYLGGEAGVATN